MALVRRPWDGSMILMPTRLGPLSGFIRVLGTSLLALCGSLRDRLCVFALASAAFSVLRRY